MESPRDNLLSSIDKLSNLCKQLSLWGFAIVGAVFLGNRVTDLIPGDQKAVAEIFSTWIFSALTLFSLSLVFHVFAPLDEALYWRRGYRNTQPDTPDSQNELVNYLWKDVSAELALVLSAYMILLIGIAALFSGQGDVAVCAYRFLMTVFVPLGCLLFLLWIAIKDVPCILLFPMAILLLLVSLALSYILYKAGASICIWVGILFIPFGFAVIYLKKAINKL